MPSTNRNPNPDPTDASPDAEPGPAPLRHLRIQPWPDPVIDRVGLDPRSDYVEQFWLGVIGPASTLLVRHLATRLEQRPDGFELDLVHTAQLLGLGTGLGRWGPMQRTVSRCAGFGLVRRWGTDGVLVRRRVPPVTLHLLARLPPERQAAHAAWQRASLGDTPTRLLRSGTLEALDQVDQ